MGPQELCLISENEGHRYMDIFDRCHPRVRDRLRNCRLNLCLACLEMHCGDDPRRQMEMIDQIERGNFDAGFFNARRSNASERDYREAERVRYFYEPTRNSPPDFDYPDRRTARDLGDAFDRGVQRRLPEWLREYRYEPRENYLRASLAPTYLAIDWATPFSTGKRTDV
jgi:hypothetical protein